MKIEVGKSYKTRGGWKARVVEEDPRSRFPMLAVHECNIRPRKCATHTQDGRNTWETGSSLWDLVTEWVDPPKPLECWVVIDTHSRNNIVVQWGPKDELEEWASTIWCKDHYTIKLMREVTDECPVTP